MGGKTSPRQELNDGEGEDLDVRNIPNLAAALSGAVNIGDDSVLIQTKASLEGLLCWPSSLAKDTPTRSVAACKLAGCRPFKCGCFVQTLEEKARKALECPCVADLVNGPCGEQFKGAFGCFIKSQTLEKGSDCIEPFTTMQQCMTINSDKFSSRVPTEEEDIEGKDEEVEEEEPEFELPIVPKNAIKLPNYLKELTENQGSR